MAKSLLVRGAISQYERLKGLSARRKLEILGVALLLGIAFFIRLQGINGGLWQDEAYTMQAYVERGPLEIIAGDNYKPNNHALYSLVLWAITASFGFSEFAVRFPAVLATVSAFMVMYIIARKYMNVKTAAVLLSILTLGSFHIFSTSTARGYGFLLLFSTLFIYYLLEYFSDKERKTNKTKKPLWLAVLFGFLSVYTYPSFILFVASTFLVLLCLYTKKSKEIIIAGGTGLFLVVLAFAPLVNGVIKYYVNFGGGFKKHTGIGWESIFTFPPEKIEATLHLVSGPVINKLESILPKLNFQSVTMIAIACIFIIGIFYLQKKAKRTLYLLLFPSIIFMVFATIFSTPLGSRSDYTIFLEFSYLIIFSAGLIATHDYVKTYLKNRSWKAGQRAYLVTLVVALGLLTIPVVYFNGKEAVARRVPLDNTKGSLEYVKNVYGAKEYKIIIYAQSTTFEFYKDKVLDHEMNVVMTADEQLVVRLLHKPTENTVLVDQVYRHTSIDEAIPGLKKTYTVDQTGSKAINIYFIPKVVN